MRTRFLLLFWIGFTFFLFSQKKEVTLLFAGDAMQHLPMINALNSPHLFTYDSCFQYIKKDIESADIACLNLETVLGDPPYSGFPRFNSPYAFSDGLKKAGFDLFFQAGNHSVDNGTQGVIRTIRHLDSIGIKHTGIFTSPYRQKLNYPLMMVRNGIRIAFLNYTYGTNGLPVHLPVVINTIDTIQIIKDIQKAKQYKPDILIANMHWGEEYATHPNGFQRKIADFLLRQGVRIIIGHHPHVVQPVEIVLKNNKIQSAVCYSLGNFISNQSYTNTEGGMLAMFTLSKDKNGKIEISQWDYRLIWVRKYYENGYKRFKIIPNNGDETQIFPPLLPKEQFTINHYFRKTKQLVEGDSR